MGLQETICLGEWVTAQKRWHTAVAISRPQRAWMAAADTAFVFGSAVYLQARSESSGVPTPEKKNDRLGKPGAGMANIQDELLPAPTGVAGGLAPLHGP